MDLGREEAMTFEEWRNYWYQQTSDMKGFGHGRQHWNVFRDGRIELELAYKELLNYVKLYGIKAERHNYSDSIFLNATYGDMSVEVIIEYYKSNSVRAWIRTHKGIDILRIGFKDGSREYFEPYFDKLLP